MYKLFLMLCMFSSIASGEELNYPDFDNDGVPDYEHCDIKLLFLKCEHPVDNCLDVKNTNQHISPYDTAKHEDEQTPTGTACEYDIDGDGIPATVADYGRLINIVNTYYIICVDYPSYTWNTTGSCDPTLNNIGDITGGLKIDYYNPANTTELTADGRPTYSDICVLIARNPVLKAKLLLPYNTSCNPIFSYYNNL